MRPFSSDILKPLNDSCTGEAIHHVGLGMHDFSVAFGNVQSISGQSKITIEIQGEIAVWEEGPVAVPVWLLVGQEPRNFELVDEFTLRMNLTSGDHIDFHSDESPYEAVIIDFGKSGDAIILEVF